MSPSILVVDEATSGKEIQRMLEASGYSVPAVVGTGDAAIEAADRSRPDLVLIELLLEGPMDGVVTASVIRERLGVPVVFLARGEDAAIRNRAMIAEPLGYVQKPVHQRELLVTIVTALGIHLNAKLHAVEAQLAESETQRRSLEQALDQRTKGMVDDTPRRRTPAATFVHDLRSPLAAIVTAVDVLKSKDPTPEVAEIYEIISRQADTMRTMIEELPGTMRHLARSDGPRSIVGDSNNPSHTGTSGELVSGRVLIVEDHRDSARAMSKMIERAGHEVFSAEDGASGLEQAKQLLPEVILCDLGLPGEVNGLDLAAAVRSDRFLRNAYLVAVSGYGEPEDLRCAQQAGFDYHVTKPVGKPALEELLRSRPRF